MSCAIVCAPTKKKERRFFDDDIETDSSGSNRNSLTMYEDGTGRFHYLPSSFRCATKKKCSETDDTSVTSSYGRIDMYTIDEENPVRLHSAPNRRTEGGAAKTSSYKKRTKRRDRDEEQGKIHEADESTPFLSKKNKSGLRRSRKSHNKSHRKSRSLRFRKKKSKVDDKPSRSHTAGMLPTMLPQYAAQALQISSDRDKKFGVMTTISAIMILYFCFGIFMYSQVLEKWSTIDALYFSVVTFCTVGYGDITPTSDASRMFCIIYAFIGITSLGMVLGIVAQEILARQEDALKAASENAGSKILDVFGSLDESDEEEETQVNKVKPSPFSFLINGLISNIPIILLIMAMAGFVGSTEGWSFLDSMYFATMTATTIGYGDFSPTSPDMRLFSVIFIPLSVGLMGAIMSTVADSFMNMGLKKRQEDLFKMNLNQEDFEKMDNDGDGEVTKIEFLSFMLVTMEKVDQDTVNKILNLFEKLDVNRNGVLDKGDFSDMIETARSKLNKRHSISE